MKPHRYWVQQILEAQYLIPVIEEIRDEQRQECAEAVRSLYRGGVERPAHLNILVTDVLNAGKLS